MDPMSEPISVCMAWSGHRIVVQCGKQYFCFIFIISDVRTNTQPHRWVWETMRMRLCDYKHPTMAKTDKANASLIVWTFEKKSALPHSHKIWIWYESKIFVGMKPSGWHEMATLLSLSLSPIQSVNQQSHNTDACPNSQCLHTEIV